MHHPFRTRRALGFLAAAAISVVAAGCFAGCATSDDRPRYPAPPGEETSGTMPDMPVSSLGEAGAACNGVRCSVPSCAAGTTTAIEGDVYDPAGKTRLYNAVVYVPNADLAPIVRGASCEKCGSVSGDPIVTTLTDEKGHFRLEGVPAGKDVPLVIQIGKWRRTIKLPTVNACATTTVADGDAHLPRNSVEGDMPQLAVVTGGFDELGCLLARIGIDGAEYTSPSSFGRVHVYRGIGGGDTTTGGAPQAPALWDDEATLAKYDAVLLSCEGWEYDEDDGTNGNKTVAAKSAMHTYAEKGGRIFATHYHYTWFKQSPEQDFRDVATWNDPSSAYGTKHLSVDTSFPKGAAFAKWLDANGASAMGMPGTLDVTNPGSNVASVNAATTQRWLYTDSPANVALMSFNTPIAAAPADQCGRAVFSDIHVSGEDGSLAVPGACGAPKLTPQELALEFLLFDLTSCVQPDSQTPQAPR